MFYSKPLFIGMIFRECALTDFVDKFYFSFFCEYLKDLHKSLLHSCTRVVSYDACTTSSADRQTDGQDHTSRPFVNWDYLYRSANSDRTIIENLYLV